MRRALSWKKQGTSRTVNVQESWTTIHERGIQVYPMTSDSGFGLVKSLVDIGSIISALNVKLCVSLPSAFPWLTTVDVSAASTSLYNNKNILLQGLAFAPPFSGSIYKIMYYIYISMCVCRACQTKVKRPCRVSCHLAHRVWWISRKALALWKEREKRHVGEAV